MTTEVIIKNKSGMVLAADSAVTVTGIGAYGQRPKVYNSANKLFTLSKTEPVGILFYNSATINGIPIELIIKEFRERFGNYKTLKKYQQYMIKFIEKFVCSHGKQILLSDFFSSFLMYVSNCIVNNKNIDSLIDDKIKELQYKQKVDSYCTKFSGISVEEIKKDFETNLFYTKEFSKFKEVTNYPKDINSLLNLYYEYIINFMNQIYTGIAICGYGKNDFFPKVYQFKIYGVLNNHLLTGDFCAHEKQDAEIIPLAQKQMIETFISGVSSKLYNTLRSFYEQNFDALIKAIVPSLKIEASPSEITSRLKNKFIESRNYFEQIVLSTEVTPLMRTLEYLSREEMAELAENLINIQVLKYKVTPELETVGGPIDVAIISKHDGFVWKKRKLYFPKDLNFQFFENYFK